MSKRRLYHVIALLMLVHWGCSSDGPRVELFRTEPHAPSLEVSSIQALNHLGATRIDEGVNFSVYSEHATRVEVLLFDDPESNEPTQQFPLTRFDNVWNLYIEGIGLGQHYGYIAWGPNWPFDETWRPGTIHGFKADLDENGHRFNPNKLLLDPYAKAIHRDHDWNKGSVASGPARTEITYGAASKAVIVESEYAWSAHETEWRKNRQNSTFVGHGWNDLVVYEVHVKGFTASPASGVDHPGTYHGVAEKADYFKELGINAVEFLPLHEKPLDGTYWGYMTLNFFAPEISYASQQKRNEVIDEFKAMVDALHQRGIEVIVDVVFNHTGEGGLWRETIEQDDVSLDPDTNVNLINFDPKEVAGVYSFRGLDNVAYYALSPDRQSYWNNTGVGNETRCNHTPMRRLILDSLRYWVEELHVDGFRFDLAPILGHVDLDYNRWDDPKNTVLQEIIDDPVLSKYNTRIIAEPWSLAHFKLGAFPRSTDNARAWSEWNGHFRDVWRSFVNVDDFRLNGREGSVDVGAAVTGSAPVFEGSERAPYHSVNFVTAHDGFTLYDLFSFDEKRNGCGVLNPKCCSDRLTPFCDKKSGEDHNRSRDWGQDNEPLKRQLMRNMFVAMLVSHGTPMLLGGDEWMRTQLGNNNAYSTGADNSWNWFDWGTWQPQKERQRMFDFVKQMIALRKRYSYALAPSKFGTGAAFAWKTANNLDMQEADWSKRHVMQHYWDTNAGAELAILINMENDWVEFTLPENRAWQRLVDTQHYFDDEKNFKPEWNPTLSANISLTAPEPVSTPKYGVAPRSIVILKAGN